jgi:hypothetical protein
VGLLVTTLVVWLEMKQAAAKSIDEMKMEAGLGETSAAGVRTVVEELSGAEGNDNRRLVIHNELGADGQGGRRMRTSSSSRMMLHRRV